MDGQPQGFDFSKVLPGQGHYYNPEFIENGVKKTNIWLCYQNHYRHRLRLVKKQKRSGQTFFIIIPSKSTPPRMDARRKILNPFR